MSNKLIVAQIEGYAKTLAEHFGIMFQRRHILEPILNNDVISTALTEKFDNTYGAYAFNHLPQILMYDMVRDISRIFLDKDKKSASFVNIHRKTSPPKILGALRNHFCQELSVSDNALQQEKQHVLAAEREQLVIYTDGENSEKFFDTTWGSVCELKAEMENCMRVKNIITLRDKIIAHLEMKPLNTGPGPYDIASIELSCKDIFCLMDRYMPVVSNLLLILTGTNYDFEDKCEVRKARGIEMWCILLDADYEEALKHS